MPGNVIIAQDDQTKAEVSRLWTAHGCTKAMTLGVPIQDPSKGPLVNIWWRAKTGRVRFDRLELTQLGEMDGPTPRVGTKVSLPVLRSNPR